MEVIGAEALQPYGAEVDLVNRYAAVAVADTATIIPFNRGSAEAAPTEKPKLTDGT